MDTTSEYLSLSEYATYRGVSKQLISKWKNASRLVLVKGRVHVRATDALLEQTMDTRGGNHLNIDECTRHTEYLSVKARETHWSAELKRIKAQRLASGLVEAKAVKQAAEKQAERLKQAVMQIPDNLAHAIAAESNPIAVHSLLLNAIRKMCNQLADGRFD